VRRSTRSGSRFDIALFAVCVLLGLVARGLPADVQDSVASIFRRSVAAPLLHLQKNAERTRTAWLAHERVATERDSLVLRAYDASALETENYQLRALLGLGSRLEWGFVVAEALHAVSLGDTLSVALAAGSDAGVRPFSAVIAPEGIVGIVHTVDPTVSLAILWTHPSFSASAATEDGSAFGIVKAHLSDGPERYLLELREVQYRSTLAPGTPIYTAGVGSVFPARIPIDTVIGELRTAAGWSRTYLVRPAVSPADVRSVMILNPRRAADGVAVAWQTPEAAEATARAIAAAGDSVARVARAAAAARQAAASSSQTTGAAPGAGTGQAGASAPGGAPAAAAVRPTTGAGTPPAGAGTPPAGRGAPPTGGATPPATARPPVVPPTVIQPPDTIQTVPPPVVQPPPPPPATADSTRTGARQ
jgi:rod shape-determining protein MreC